jgi:dihydrofolate reductase
MNSSLLKGDAAASIRALKQQPGKDILVMGSGELVRSLIGAQVIDEFVLLTHPIVLGAGTRLFSAAGPFFKLGLASSTTTPTGVVVATYHPEREV